MLAFASLFTKKTVDKNIKYFAYFVLLYPFLHILIALSVPNSIPLSISQLNSPLSFENQWVGAFVFFSIDFIAALFILRGYLGVAKTILVLNALVFIFAASQSFVRPDTQKEIFFLFIITYFLSLWKFIIFQLLLFYNKCKTESKSLKWKKNALYFLKYLLLYPFILGLIGYYFVEPEPPFVPKILSETKKEIGYGYTEVRRSQTNHPDHWEGVGHFSFVYYGDEKLCQCDSISGFNLSPSGKYALYHNVYGPGLTLRETATGKTRKIEHPKNKTSIDEVKWDEDKGEAWVAFWDLKGNHPNPLVYDFKVDLKIQQ